MYLNETMTEKQERQKGMSWHIFRISIYLKIPALSSNECYIIIDFYTLITYTFYITYTYNYQNNHWRCPVRKSLAEILQNSQENTSARVSFLIKSQVWGLQFY